MKNIKARLQQLEKIIAELPAYNPMDAEEGCREMDPEVIFEAFVDAVRATFLDNHEDIVNFMTQTIDDFFRDPWPADMVDEWATAVLEYIKEERAVSATHP